MDGFIGFARYIVFNGSVESLKENKEKAILYYLNQKAIGKEGHQEDTVTFEQDDLVHHYLETFKGYFNQVSKENEAAAWKHILKAIDRSANVGKP